MKVSQSANTGSNKAINNQSVSTSVSQFTNVSTRTNDRGVSGSVSSIAKDSQGNVSKSYKKFSKEDASSVSITSSASSSSQGLQTSVDVDFPSDGDRSEDDSDSSSLPRKGKHLLGGTGHDRLLGSSRDDFFRGGAGDDLLRGGKGVDKASFYARRNMTISNKFARGQGKDTLYSIEIIHVNGSYLSQKVNASAFKGRAFLYGRGGHDTLVGGHNHDKLFGGNGHDLLYGNKGHDYLLGNAGKDKLWGGDGKDRLIGGAHNDRIVGGFGQDRLTGGGKYDSDTFVYNSIAEGKDIITDFERIGKGKDRLVVKRSGFTPSATGISRLKLGVLANNRLVLGSDNLGSRAGFRYFQTSGKLYFDANGDNAGGLQWLAKLENGRGSTVPFFSLDGGIVVV